MKKPVRFAATAAMVATIIVLFRVLPNGKINNTTVALTLLLAILGVSAWWGLAEATVASLLAILGFNFFFLPPIGKFTIQDPQNLVAFLAFLVTAVTASQLSQRARRRTAEAEARRLEIERLYALVQAMLRGGSTRKAVRQFVNSVVQVFGCEAAAFWYRPADEIVRTGPESKVVSDHDLLAAAETDDVSIDVERALAVAPVRLGGRTLGSMALIGRLPSEQAVRAIVNLVALTVEKERALEDAGHAEAARQSEVLKSALLDSLAHDIKTPLTSIKAAVTSLLGTAPASETELLTIINEEADRLNDLSAEVIAMARIEAGKLHLEKELVQPAEVITGVLAEYAGLLLSRTVTVDVAAGLPPAEADRELAEQVIRRFLENALNYSPEGSPIRVSAELKGGKIVIGVGDRGPGIQENERMLIFDKFYRGRQHRFGTKGTGMGLAIAKGIVEAHGERIWVESEPGAGAVFYFSLPAAGGSKLERG
jgi:two-component system sensor histidine kinase KdpD